MSKLFILIGLPGSGKSSIASKYAEKHNAVIHSSDELRKEMFGRYDVFDKDSNNIIFKELHNRIKVDLHNGINVIYDATNINYKKRRSFIQSLDIKGSERSKYKITAVVIATTISDCIFRDMKRSVDKQVGKDVIIRMWKGFNFPIIQEGFDVIKIVYNSEFDYTEKCEVMISAANVFQQDNKHHSLNLGDHMRRVATEYMNDIVNFKVSKVVKVVKLSTLEVSMLDVLLNHDVGKLYTKSFKNSKGIVTDEAHYYGHENVSAYESMFLIKDSKIFDNNKIRSLGLIQWHMLGNNIHSDKGRNKWIKFLGQEFYDDLMMINKYDKMR